jgi:hypothetical protein
MYPGARFYGIKEIMLGYAHLPKFLPFPVAIHHGWHRDVHDFEAVAKPPEIWVWSERIAREMIRFYPRNKIRIVGSFFCYLMESIKNELPPKEKNGSICIPPHSSHFAKTEYSVDKFARALDQLGDDFKPVTVMLYYLDMDPHTVSAYKSFGFNVVSNGNLFDENFLRNFIHNVYDKKHCIFSDLGSGVIYAGYLGLNLHHLELPSQVKNLGNPHLTKEYIETSFRFDKDFLLSINSASINEEMGANHLLSPQELRRAILRNYFTWSFVRTFTYTVARRIGGAVLRRIGLRRRSLNV